MKTAMFRTFFCLSLFFTLSHGLGKGKHYEFITDILNFYNVDTCVLGHVSDDERPKISNELISNYHDRWLWHEANDCTFFLIIIIPRQVMVKTITGPETSVEILQSQNKCILHFLDIANINITRAYLKSAWNAGALGPKDFYLLAIENINQVPLLNFSEIFDFQRLLIAATSVVWTLKYSLTGTFNGIIPWL